MVGTRSSRSGFWNSNQGPRNRGIAKCRPRSNKQGHSWRARGRNIVGRMWNCNPSRRSFPYVELATMLSNDDYLGVLHNSIICFPPWESWVCKLLARAQIPDSVLGSLQGSPKVSLQIKASLSGNKQKQAVRHDKSVETLVWVNPLAINAILVTKSLEAGDLDTIDILISKITLVLKCWQKLEFSLLVNVNTKWMFLPCLMY